MSEENALKIVSPLYLLHANSACWKCGADQEVVSLATRSIIEPKEDRLGDEDEPVILSNVEEIPDPVRRHVLAIHPRFEKRMSRTAGEAYYMGKGVGAERLEAACARALRFGTCSYRSIKSILEKGLERQKPEPELPLSSPVHQNVRGQAYYAAASKAEGLC